jgi:hypothetical protein
LKKPKYSVLVNQHVSVSIGELLKQEQARLWLGITVEVASLAEEERGRVEVVQGLTHWTIDLVSSRQNIRKAQCFQTLAALVTLEFHCKALVKAMQRKPL